MRMTDINPAHNSSSSSARLSQKYMNSLELVMYDPGAMAKVTNKW